MSQPVGAGTTKTEVLTPDEICFRRAFQSQTLHRAPAMRTLLAYLWQHRQQPLSEYAVAVEALGRKDDFDPKHDATVRVQVARLRQKLREFYENEDPQAELRLSIPLGGHSIEAVPVAAAAAPPPSAAAAMPAPGSTVSEEPRRAWLWLAGLAVGALIAYLAWQNIELRKQMGHARLAELPAFWQKFLAGGKPVSLVLPTPVFFYWEGRRLVVRDSHVNEFQQRGTSQYLKTLEEQFGPPTILQHYTVATDTAAALRLSQYMEQYGQHLLISSAPELSLDSFLDRNLILVGNPGTSDHLQQLLERSNFHMAPGAVGTVRNRKPGPGEPAMFTEVRQSDRRTLVPGIVSLFPGRAPGTRLLLLTGRHPAALVSFLISQRGLELLDRELSRTAGPEYFEMVIAAEVEGVSVLKAEPLAFRALAINR